MKPAVVADVGNTRIKWGRCHDGQVVDAVSLPPDDPQAWQEQIRLWNLARPSFWVAAGVHPQRRDRLAEWLREQGDSIHVLNSSQELPLRVLVEQPDRVGIDRLLNAVAASRRVRPDQPAILVDAGSAITVDYLDELQAFAGGAILPGIRLMARSLHDYTALLPLVNVEHAAPPMPATSTAAAIEAGIYWAAVGAIQALVRRLQTVTTIGAELYLTGGDGPLLAMALDVEVWPNMTLEGIRIAAEALP
ncbi:MAG TPA: type III pantothenate kinase [Gemmataceae bacterium]|nr:type III pantothenate kinase [Gemmataceae bacterium]